MKQYATTTIALLLFCLTAAIASDSPATPANWHSGVGTSDLADPAAAAESAAAQAKAHMDGVPAKFVMLVAAAPQLVPELIEGAKKYFPQEIIYGCQVTSPLTPASNFPGSASIDAEKGVAVWALGGDVDFAFAHVRTDVPDDDDIYYNAGIKLAQQLKDAVENSKRPGRFILTFGDQYNGSNKDFALGLNDGFEKVWPIIGAAAGNVTAKVIVKGEITAGVNMGILIAGEFTLGQAMNGGTHTPETADKTLREAIDQGEKEPFFALIFNCRRRRQGMMERNQLTEELEAMKTRLPGVDFFGFYGPGEIGASSTGEPAQGMGFTVVTAVLFAN